MPNWVYSTLGVKGSKTEVKEFRKKYEDDEGSLENERIKPYPKEFKLLDKKYKADTTKRFNKRNPKKKEVVDELTEDEYKEITLIGLEGKWDTSQDGYNQGGYEWCLKNWGTKWGICECNVTDDTDDEEISYTFSTAWSPCEPLIIEMSKKFPNLTFDYFCDEESGEFRYRQEWKDGILIETEDLFCEIEEERQQEAEDYAMECAMEEKAIEKAEENKNG